MLVQADEYHTQRLKTTNFALKSNIVASAMLFSLTLFSIIDLGGLIGEILEAK